jgi:hypothetical protein
LKELDVEAKGETDWGNNSCIGHSDILTRDC